MAGDERQGENPLKLKISKKAYVFDVKKKYSVNRNFLLKKEPETPAEGVKAQLEEFFKKRRQQPQQGASQKPEKPPINTAMLTVLFVSLIFIFGGIAYVMWKVNVQPSGTSSAPTAPGFIGKYDFSVADSDIITSMAGASVKRQAYALVAYSSDRLASLNFTLKLYPRQPTTQVFLLDYARDGADNYPVFRKRLLDGLAAQQMPASEIGISELAGLPAGATIIVPTGYLPSEFFGTGSAFDYKSVLKSGSNIIYIGLETDRVLDQSGTTLSSSNADFAFSPAKLQSTDGFNLFDGQYVASPGKSGAFTSSGMLYGSVSVLCYEKGCMLFLPQNLDGGWRGDEKYSPGEVAANDILRIINDEEWLPAIASASVPAKIGVYGPQMATLLTPQFSGTTAYAELAAEATDLQGSSSRTLDVFNIRKRTNGELQVRDDYALPYYLSGQPTRLNMQLAEKDLTPVKLFVRVYKDGTVLQEDDLEFGLTVPDKQKSKDIQMDVEPGDYILKVTDKSGQPYAAAAVSVANPTVAINGTPNWASQQFVFFVSANGVQLAPRTITVSMDGKHPQTYDPASYLYSKNLPYMPYSYPEQIKPGVHNFTFTSGNWTTELPLEFRQQKYMWDNPLVLILGALAIMVFAAAQMLKRPEVQKYGLDIPDFPPQSTMRIPVKRDSVLQIFNDTNADFSWQWMPLRLDELKNGFRRLTYNGKPILIGDFNLERILSKLKTEGLVKEELGYWGRSDWVAQSKHSIRYLAIYRIMRNVFVNNAVKFSKLDSIAECDVKVIAGKDEKYFHIMEGAPERIIHRALATAKKGTTLIIFATEDERDAFRTSLISTSKLAVALKMEMQNGNILLLPVKNAISAYLKGITG